MMLMGTNPCYPNINGTQNNIQPIYGVSEEAMDPNSSTSSSPSSTHPSSFLYNLSLLKEKVHQVQSLASLLPESTALATPMMGTLIQEIIVTASSMMFACQQTSLASSSHPAAPAFDNLHHDNKIAAAPTVESGPPQTFFAHDHDTVVDHWYGDQSYNNCNSSNDHRRHNNNNSMEDVCGKESPLKMERDGGGGETVKKYDIIELEAADLLAKYTHYCQVCGKGFKRDANLRMHMRAHGDEYKSSAALSNPVKKNSSGGGGVDEAAQKYSCPQEGCRWNKRHARFQPLKSMICVKNHYKRSHCPKMYVCKRCSRKQFSVLSDLRTHEKHCGDLKWQCTCGTTFSRKDKLMGHVALFLGHAPAPPPAINPFGAPTSA